MHKIYLLTAPTHTQTMFTAHTPPLQEDDYHTDTTHRTLLQLGLHTNNILQTNHSTLTFFTTPNTRLLKQKHSLAYQDLFYTTITATKYKLAST